MRNSTYLHSPNNLRFLPLHSDFKIFQINNLSFSNLVFEKSYFQNKIFKIKFFFSV